MEFSIRHAIPGRVRLHVPVLCAPSPLAESALSWLKQQDFIDDACIKYDCASLIIHYEPAKLDEVDALLEMLEGFSLADLGQLLQYLDPTGGARAVGAARSQTVPERPRWPLALPSLSLAMAFSSNPVLFALNVPLMLHNAFPIFRRAWHVWRTEQRLNVDFLDTLAISVSIGQGNMVTGGVITWLIRLGDWIRDLTAAGSKRAVTELLEFQSKTAWVVRDGEIVAVPATELAVDDSVVVYPGEMIPVDGEITHGHGMIDQKTITGEGLPVSRKAGEAVFAATVLREGQLTLRALRVGAQTTAGQIAHLVDSAPIGDTRMQNHAERFADRLVMPTLGLAIGTALLSRDFNRFLSLVIVDFGTGIRVAAPTAVLSSMTHAARAGIVIKSGGHMEKLAQVDTVVFDKTGTLSVGTPHVVQMQSFMPNISSEHLLELAVAAETHLQHPVAEALREKSRELRLLPPPCDETEYRIGLGVEGQVNGYYMHVGSERFLRQNEIRVDHIAAERTAIDARGCSSLYVAIDGKLAGLIAYEDRIRPESRDIVETLHRMGIRDTIMLTGDNAVVARAVGERVGLTRQVANMMPADKAEVILQLQREGRVVAMVGDGINDSPALSFADVGIAMKYGADITHESADVVLMEDSLWKLIKAIEISRGAVGLIKQNYGIVAAMNAVALGLALPGGLVSPEITAVISNGSAIVASLNGIRPALRRS
ncbi:MULTISPECIES: heavy metal translocating P-type ATPase [Burkholderiaceae]|uniref:heavy metal translocating P-type ATPase n=1 Tax=Burkholderiaceae TaxID=119060 RepID=UPI00141EE2A2|nr:MULTISPECIES: heavy metal translocating P-type ATPase [Burkholderiaceae]MBN3851211.1 cadmium-translocating P-type ATPase [Paraburkholderia sp. Ac-20342]NIF56476.1 cadmium-translocating P-type ATPase [Burkholderia sp. Ax-1724]